MSDFSVFLIILAVIISVLVVVINIYVLINYQHPDDRNQAYFPKFVVVRFLPQDLSPAFIAQTDQQP